MKKFLIILSLFLGTKAFGQDLVAGKIYQTIDTVKVKQIIYKNKHVVDTATNASIILKRRFTITLQGNYGLLREDESYLINDKLIRRRELVDVVKFKTFK